MRDRLLSSATGLLGFGGVALILFTFFGVDIQRSEEVAHAVQPVKARLLAKSLQPHAVGRPSNRPSYTYTPIGAFEIVGAPGRVYEGVDLDNGTLRATEAEATQAAARYREGMIVDAWFDPRSRGDQTFFPLTVKDPSAVVEEQRAQQRLFRWIGGASLLAGGVCAVLLFRRPGVTRP
jgi:Protein of unknown function (DUF3592)